MPSDGVEKVVKSGADGFRAGIGRVDEDRSACESQSSCPPSRTACRRRRTSLACLSRSRFLR